MSKSERAQALADDWPYWLRNHRFFGPPQPKHILAMLSMPDTGGEPPDAKLSAEMAAFHLGVIGLPDHLGRAFVRVYCGWPNLPIKTLAAQDGICPSVYYDRAHKGANDALAGMRRAMNIVENMGLLLYREKTEQNRPLQNGGHMVSSLSR